MNAETSAIKVLHLLPWSNLGGTERQASFLVGHAPPGFSCFHAMPDGPGKSLMVSAGSMDSGVSIRYPLTVPDFPKVYRSLVAFVITAGIDAVHVHGSREFAYFLGREGRVPRVVFTPHAYVSRADRLLAAIAGNRADKVICLTNEEAESLRASGLAEGKAVVIPNGIPIPPYGDTALNGSKGTGGPFVVGTVSRLAKDKGLDGIIKAVPSMDRGKGVRVRIAGAGPESGPLESLARSLGVVLDMVGPVTDPFGFLSTLDAFVLPSERETFGMAVIEAMAMGLPVVTTPVGAMRDAVVDGVTGFLVGVGDVPAITRALSTLMHDGVRRMTMGAEARKRVEVLYPMSKCALLTHSLYAARNS